MEGEVKTLSSLYQTHHPEYAGDKYIPVLGEEGDRTMCESSYDATLAELKSILAQAASHTTVSVCIPSSTVSGTVSDTPTTDIECSSRGTLRTHDALRHAVSLLNSLARFLPADDVRWSVVPKFLGREPFVEFSECDVRARAILVRGMFDLLAILHSPWEHRPSLSIVDTVATISASLAIIATDMNTLYPLLHAIRTASDLPRDSFRLGGAWTYDAEQARRQMRTEIASKAHATNAQLSALLEYGLRVMKAVVDVVGFEGVGFLSNDLVTAVFSLPGSCTIQRIALALVCSILDVVTADESGDPPGVTEADRDRRKAVRGRVGAVIKEAVVPALERLVAQDYPLWKFSSSYDVYTVHQQHPPPSIWDGDSLTASEKVEPLARCYAFLLCCNRMGWAEVEAKATQPHSFSQMLFFRKANTAARHFATFLMSHSLRYAPQVLQIQIFSNDVLRVWLQSMFDPGRRHVVAWYLTSEVLMKNDATKALFDEEARGIDIRGDWSGEKRAKIVECAMRKMGQGAIAGGRANLSTVLLGLDEILVHRKKDVAEHATIDSDGAVREWYTNTSRILVGVVRGIIQGSGGGGGVGALAPTVSALVRKLMTRLAHWIVDSVPSLGNSSSTGTDTVLQDMELDHHLSSIADARQWLSSSSAFSQLPQYIDILTQCGAPACLDGDAEVLLSLAVVVSGGVEGLGGGAELPTHLDIAIFDAFAESFSNRSVVGGENGYSTHQQLAVYVLSTFVRRYLERSCLRHSTHERAAVNALRLARSILSSCCMRGKVAQEGGVMVLMRPLLVALSGGVGGGAGGLCIYSLGIKAEIYRMLSELAQSSSVLPLHPYQNPNHGSDASSAALHAFWVAVCRDALSFMASRLSTQGQARAEACIGERALQASTQASVAEASNQLMAAQGRLHYSSHTLEAVYNRMTARATAPSAGAGTGGTGALRAPDPTPLTTLPFSFRPSDFHWTVLANGLLLLQSVMLHSREWADALFPAVYHYYNEMVASQLCGGGGGGGRGGVPTAVEMAYSNLRRRLQETYGAGMLHAYVYPLQPPPAPPAPAPAPLSSLHATARPPMAPMHISPHQPTCITADQSIAALASGPKGTIAPITALLHATDEKKAVMCVRDYSRPGEVEARANVVISSKSPALWKQLLGVRVGPGRPSPVIRLNKVQLLKSAEMEDGTESDKKNKILCVVTTLPDTVVELDPCGPYAAELSRRQMDETALAPVHAHAEEECSQATVQHVVQVKQSKENAAGTGDGLSTVKEVLRTLGVEMGYGEREAKRVMKRVMEELNKEGKGRWRQLGKEALIQRAIEYLKPSS